MYFALDDFGDENLAALKALTDSDAQWRRIADIARSFDVPGIQLSPKYQSELQLDLMEIPDRITQGFRLTYHLGGVFTLTSDDAEKNLRQQMEDSHFIAVSAGVEDISIHPPVALGCTEEEIPQAVDRLAAVVAHWLPKLAETGITLSLETHISPGIFVLSGPEEYRRFVLGLPGLKALVDVSHNQYDGFDPVALVESLPPGSITGLHLSDAVTGVPYNKGTHLPIGQGEVDFQGILNLFDKDDSVCAALEVRGSAGAVADSFARLKEIEAVAYKPK